MKVHWLHQKVFGAAVWLCLFGCGAGGCSSADSADSGTPRGDSDVPQDSGDSDSTADGSDTVRTDSDSGAGMDSDSATDTGGTVGDSDSSTISVIHMEPDTLAVTEWPFDEYNIDTAPKDTDTASVCGDGVLAANEACDDGNTEDSDGCSPDCLEVEEQYLCIPPGVPCHLIASCGDGAISLPELCDDGNVEKGDGCSDLCQTEIGFECTGEPSDCTKTQCGDNSVDGAESCDDGNTIPFDGCSADCQLEPNCSDGSCVSECGDGLLLGATEECDDGNHLSGDGCSAVCEVEPGYTCVQDDCADGDECPIRVNVIYRDFPSSHPDFQVSCGSQMDGMVEAELDTDWRPVATDSAPDGCITQFEDWYTNDLTVLGSAIPFKVDEIVLFPNGDGSFVNRYGDDGERWLGYALDQWTGEGVSVTPIADTVAECDTDGCVPCATQENLGMGCPPPTVEYDGNPLFFPVDDLVADETYTGSVPAQYGWAQWPTEEWVTGEANQHNFSFTSEVGYWFQFDASAEATLDFSGDDDVWVFINGQLAVDLGAPHVPQNAGVTISATNRFGMTDGGVYRVHFFHAERKATGSSFKLSLVGFNTSRSFCRPTCGDGVVGIGEECDNGVNEGGYGQCGPDCTYDGYCGDGVVQEAYEHCDDGNYNNNDECPSSCRIINFE
ncbi:MAG: DUF4215 domain-containing protein [Deltaproteobacteria bacterium]|nr:DUF4215 domain-containing protein [Deltaproteobacteria bacterium]